MYLPQSMQQTGFMNLGDGRPALLYNGDNSDVINRHFYWLNQYGIDGLAVQRFTGVTIPNSPDFYRSNDILEKVRSAAQTYQRLFYVSYDISDSPNMNNGMLAQTIEDDWQNNIVNNLNLTSSSSYAHQNGNAVVGIYGIGLNGNAGSDSECIGLIQWFKARGVYVIGLTPESPYWRDSYGVSKSAFQDVYAQFNAIAPWSVGGYTSSDDF